VQAPPLVETVLSFDDLQVDFEKRQVLFRQAPVAPDSEQSLVQKSSYGLRALRSC